MTIKSMAFSGILGALAAASCLAAEVGAPVEVAPKAEGTRSQGWAGVAWNEGAKCWLVAWREGYLNEPETGTDIWCARVSSDGKALDPAGIRLTRGKGLKDSPKVASDGKGWLVVWEDLSNGKDWDVRGARVSGEGKALDAEGILVAGGADNQCRPAVAFAGGNYFAVWQGYRGGGEPGEPGTGYAVYGARVAPDGKFLDAKPIELAASPTHQILEPSVVGRGDDALITCTVMCGGRYQATHLGSRLFDARSGQPKGPPIQSIETEQTKRTAFDAEGQRSATLAAGAGGAVAILQDKSKSYQGHARLVWQLNANWEFVSSTPFGGGGATLFRSSPAAAFDGERYLVAMDWGDDGRDRDKNFQTEVRGWFVGADGKLLDDPAKGFVIAAEAGKSAMLPAVAGGPKGVCLVVYSEIRGADDMKLLARLVR